METPDQEVPVSQAPQPHSQRPRRAAARADSERLPQRSVLHVDDNVLNVVELGAWGEQGTEGWTSLPCSGIGPMVPALTMRHTPILHKHLQASFDST